MKLLNLLILTFIVNARATRFHSYDIKSNFDVVSPAPYNISLLYSSINVKSQITCLTDCNINKACLTVTYFKLNETCYFYGNVFNISQLTASSYSTVYTKTEICDLDTQYWNGAVCINYATNNQTCKLDKDCLGNLRCSNLVCSCNSSFQFWSTNYSTCLNYFSYNQGVCTTNNECSSNLICQKSGVSCSCPKTTANGYCDCPTRVVGAEFYWNGSSCTPANAYNQTCSNSSASYMCQTVTQGTICSGTSTFRCICSSQQYFNIATQSCQSLLSVNQTCMQTDACKSSLGLSCQSGLCLCNSTQFWSATLLKCTNYFSYNQGVCTASNQCGSNLICKANGASCLCPANITNGYCDCPSRINGAEYYWNGTRCIPAGAYGASCSVDYECQVLTQFLKCDTCSTKKCICSNGIWDSTQNICVPCASGWFAQNNACYKSAWCPPVFQSITQAQLTSNTYCGTVSGHNVVLAPSFSNCDLSWLSQVCSPAISALARITVDVYYFGPIQGGQNCKIYQCALKSFGPHPCSHGADHHGIICMYT